MVEKLKGRENRPFFAIFPFAGTAGKRKPPFLAKEVDMNSKMLKQHQDSYRQGMEFWKVQLWLLFSLHKLLLVWVHISLLIKG